MEVAYSHCLPCTHAKCTFTLRLHANLMVSVYYLRIFSDISLAISCVKS